MLVVEQNQDLKYQLKKKSMLDITSDQYYTVFLIKNPLDSFIRRDSDAVMSLHTDRLNLIGAHLLSHGPQPAGPVLGLI